jgi:hypothetical protein
MKMHLKEIVFMDMLWIHLAQGKVQWQTLVSAVLNL